MINGIAIVNPRTYESMHQNCRTSSDKWRDILCKSDAGDRDSFGNMLSHALNRSIPGPRSHPEQAQELPDYFVNLHYTQTRNKF